ncbi:MAG: HAD-IIIA family hydrolase [Sphingobacteriales bacterium]|jgi:D-glycero-D-manno-heptose 1,7-bisphosphate phosphatase|nr:HAD-IIIA family hydrolase [Sphingobacteriales bacterium]MBP9140308.1 HAD-IIIA family hydrolase [Chitinophagales bacterium]MDA0197165.1 HAD-IIIA family hydrolase [Bacteroidota bacterium]MBK6891410.1 HAD-IIIA family hydrolase [Sphingobacteriales bacterium]MBK7526758.1 HAD-IIIA family hydrolase [Sphingobacteriales bacterium]
MPLLPLHYQHKLIQSWQINPSWTLFLDRDGVINYNLPNQPYIQYPHQLQYINNSPYALSQLMPFFGLIIVVTNQQAIGKSLMTKDNLNEVFKAMQQTFLQGGANINAYYYCPHLSTVNCSCRKPKTQMAIQAQADFCTIQFSQAVMIGDQRSDMLFGKNMGMKTVFLTANSPQYNAPPPFEADVVYPTLLDFVTQGVLPSV